jgi:hypothetical protein
MRSFNGCFPIRILTALTIALVGDHAIAKAQNGQAAGSEFRVTLLGTSTPNPLPDRFGPSTLVEAGAIVSTERQKRTIMWT